MTDFLTQDEISELTGKKRPAVQIAWLSEKGWVFETNAAGRPIIHRDSARYRMGGATQTPQPIGKQPNFSALA
jgi:hypothetical protein